MAEDFDGEYGAPPEDFEYEQEGNNLDGEELIRSAKYRSTGICNALNIKRERLKDWIKAGFVKPTLPAFGQGTKAGYTKGDVYAIALFMKLLNMGFKREFAASLIEPVIGSLGNEVFFRKYLVLTIESTDVGEEEKITPTFLWGGDWNCKIEFTPSSFTSTTDSINLTNWDGAFIFNLAKLCREVDKALEAVGA